MAGGRRTKEGREGSRGCLKGLRRPGKARQAAPEVTAALTGSSTGLGDYSTSSSIDISSSAKSGG